MQTMRPITIREFRALLGNKISRQTVFSKIKSGEMKHVKTESKIILIPFHEAKKWVLVEHGEKTWLERNK